MIIEWETYKSSSRNDTFIHITLSLCSFSVDSEGEIHKWAMKRKVAETEGKSKTHARTTESWEDESNRLVGRRSLLCLVSHIRRLVVFVRVRESEACSGLASRHQAAHSKSMCKWDTLISHPGYRQLLPTESRDNLLSKTSNAQVECLPHIQFLRTHIGIISHASGF